MQLRRENKMIDENIEYRQLLVDEIASGNYHSYSKKQGESFPFRLKKTDKRVNPPHSALLILRYFLFKDVADWSLLSFNERQAKIEYAQLAFLCWLGDEESYENGRLILKEDFNRLVKDNKGAYQILCEKYSEAEKLANNRTAVIESLKKPDNFFKKGKCKGKYDYAPYRFDTLIPNAIALGPLKSYVVAFKKDEIKQMFDILCSYKFVGHKDFNVVKEKYWANILLLSILLRIKQVRYYKGDVDQYIDISNEEIFSLLDRNHKIIEKNGSDIKFNIKLVSSSKGLSLERIEEGDYAFDCFVNPADNSLNNLWRPKSKITQYIHIFEEKYIPDTSDYIFIKGNKGPDYTEVLINEFQPYL